MGILNALNRFFVPALSPAMFNVASIATMVALTPVMPWVGLHPIAAVAAGVIAGGLAQLLCQVPLLRREGFRYRPLIDWRDRDLRAVLLLMGPGTFGLAATQINIFVNTVLATGEGTGAVSWLNYAFRLMYLPLGIIGVSIATAAVPSIARHAERDDRGGMRHELANALSMMLVLSLPATAGLMVLAHPIVSLLFERGAFAPRDTLATAAALVAYAAGLAGYSAVRIATPAFYALRESRTPVIVTAVTVAVNVALNLILVRYFGYIGLAVGTSAAALLNAALLLALLRRRLHGLEGRRLAGVLLRTLAATLAMALTARLLIGGLASVLTGSSLWAQGARLGLTIAVALAVLVASARLAGLREMTDLVQALRTRLGRGRP
jgi:putative peptidoglycan lipid II flippase